MNNEQTTIFGLTKGEWLELSKRYFDAATTDEEERLLRRFAATKEAEAPEFEELRAVMGFLAVGKKLKDRSARKRNAMRILCSAAAVAAICAVAFSGWFIYDRSQNQCVAYIGGVRYTNEKVVFAEMHRSLNSVDEQSADNAVNTQLNDIFESINEYNNQ